MHGLRSSNRRKSCRRLPLVLILAVFLVVLYGFHIQTKNFHPKAGFQSHRKVLRETEQTFVEVSKKLQKEAEELSTASNKQSDLPAAERDTALSSTLQTAENAQNTVKRASAELATVAEEIADLVQRTADEHEARKMEYSDKRHDHILEGLVQEQELRLTHFNKTNSGFQALPPMRSELQPSVRSSDLYKLDLSSEALTFQKTDWSERQEAVKTATKETWATYEQYAMGADELRPLSLQGKTTFGEMGATIIDSLDTLWMMELKEEFERAKLWVAQNLTFEKPAKLSLFETTIRIVGGLLSAYDLSEDMLFLDRAKKLVDMLMPVFDAAQSGIPNNIVYINQGQSKKVRAGQLGRAAIAEFGTIQVEFLALSQRTANTTYGQKTEAILKRLHDANPEKALLPVWYNRKLGKAAGSNLYTIGAMGDSYFEYLLKLWLLHRKEDDTYRSRWEKATDEALEKLVAISPTGLTFVGQRRSVGKLIGKMEHLACYFPGNMALGVSAGAVSGIKAQHYMEVAANLTYTCWQMYERTASGLGMDLVLFDDNGDLQPKGAMNMLRPETIESLFYMWRVTREEKYREWGWKMFKSFQKHSRTPEGAFACVENVNEVPVKQQDGMETFWLAETLKYLWLLFGPDDLLSLEDWVLNSEAHPLRVHLPT